MTEAEGTLRADRAGRPPRLVLDTNVLVAAIRSRSGAANAVLQLLGAGAFVPLVSVPLSLEYEAVLMRAEHRAVSGASPADLQGLLGYFHSLAEPVVLHFLWRPQLTDPADEMVLETAINGRASHIVTFNVSDFAPATRFGILVRTRAEILRSLKP